MSDRRSRPSPTPQQMQPRPFSQSGGGASSLSLFPPIPSSRVSRVESLLARTAGCVYARVRCVRVYIPRLATIGLLGVADAIGNL